MVRSNPKLWRRLAKFEVSPEGAVFSFVKRLAHENRWSPELARRTFDEYRRFLYLAVVVGQRLTPSEAVGQVWQLHRTYPASYGQTLCHEVLGQRPHSEPSEAIGGPAGRAASYRATLAAYEQEFGCAPPAEIWPVPDQRSVAAAASSERPAARRPRRAARKARLLPAASLMPAADRA
jgi:hypothetical protein